MFKISKTASVIGIQLQVRIESDSRFLSDDDEGVVEDLEIEERHMIQISSLMSS